MSILSNTFTDPLFDKVWKVHPDRWGNGVLNLPMDEVELIAAQLKRVFMSDIKWHTMLNQSCAAHWVYEKKVPKKYWDQVDKCNEELFKIIHDIDPTIRYIRIEYNTMVQGANTHIPDIRIHFDRNWFGYDSSESKLSPNFGTHRPTARISVEHDALNYTGYQGSRPNAKPKPKFPDFFPNYDEWEKVDFFDERRTKVYESFPGNETSWR